MKRNAWLLMSLCLGDVVGARAHSFIVRIQS